MRNWAKWFVHHRMRWVLYIVLIVSVIPISLIVAISNIPQFLNEMKNWVTSDWKAIGKEK